MTKARLVQRATGLLKTFNEAGVLDAADVHVALRLQQLGGENAETVLLAVALTVRAVRLGAVCVDLRRLADVSVDERYDVDVAALPWPARADLLAALRRSPLVGGGENGPLCPLRLVDTDPGSGPDGQTAADAEPGELLYLDRYFRQEQTIRRVLDERAAGRPEVDLTALAHGLAALFAPMRLPAASPDRQRIAAALALTRWTTVIAGGPGTGKTHTVARILSLLFDQHGASLRVGLAAPTGRAAAQLQESVSGQTAALGLPTGLSAMTLHRLLGWQRGSSSRFRHHAGNHLPYDVVVVDETSMVSLTLMCRLLEAVRPDARLILVGDPDQLTSVDAGAVLADLVARPVTEPENPALAELVGPDLAARNVAGPDVVEPDVAARDVAGPQVTAGLADSVETPLTPAERDRLRGGVVRLSRGRRFGGAIAQLAVAVQQGRPDEVLELLDGGSSALCLHGAGDTDAVRSDLTAAAEKITEAALRGDSLAALAALEEHRLLCAHREGPYGVKWWAQQTMEWISAASGAQVAFNGWFPGQPLLVTANDYEAGIFNGDTGVIIAGSSSTGGNGLAGGGATVMAAFRRGNEPVLLHPSRLSAVQTVYAMTIHRSQGSQYDTVSIVLPGEESSLLSRELLYTAITRARKRVRLIGSQASVRAGVERQVVRASGLRRQLRE